MKIIMALIVATTVLGMSAQANAQMGFFSGNKVLEFCESESRAAQGTCSGYLAGVFDSAVILKASSVAKLNICAQSGVTLGQLIKIFIKWANDNPGDLHVDASIIAMGAFAVAFPCE